MNRKCILRLSVLLCLALAGLPHLSPAFQTDRTDTYKSDYIKRGDGSSMLYRVGFFERKVLSTDANEKVEIVMDIFSYLPAGGTEAGARYHLQRIGAPVQEGNNWVIRWKLDSREKEDVMKGKFPKTVVTKLTPQRFLFLELSKTETIKLDYSNPYEDDEE